MLARAASSKVLSSPMRTRWNSSWREYGKCSHRWLLTATPRFFSSALRICVTSGAQPPQPVPALVCVFSAPTVVQPRFDGRADGALADVVAGADLRGVGQRGRRRWPRLRRAGRAAAGSGPPGARAAACAFSTRLQQRAVVGGVADQHAAEQLLAVGVDHQLLVDPAALVDERRRRARRASPPCASPKRATSTPMQLELGAHVGAGERTCASPREMRAPRPRAIW